MKVILITGIRRKEGYKAVNLNEHVAFKSLKTCKERKQSKQSGPP
jgi:hypothetical protein